MKTITKADLPKIRSILALHCPPENLVVRKWSEVSESMGSVPLQESIRGMKVVLFLVKKAETILVDEVALRGTESTMHGLDTLNKIKSEASELLTALEG